MSLRGWAPGKEILEPRGMWSAVAERRKGNPERASYCQNVRFAPGVVRSRPGTYSVTTVSPVVGKIVKGLAIGTLGSGFRYWYLLGTQIRCGLLQSGVIVAASPFDYSSPAGFFNDTLAGTPYTISVSIYNKLAYIAVSDKSGNGCAPCLISDGASVLDVAFSNVTQYRSGLQFGGGFGMTFTALGAGNCSPGAANYALVLQNGSGFLSAPIVQTAPSIGSASKIQASVTIPANTSLYGNATVYLLKTRVDNPNAWYWIPNDPITGSIGSIPFPPSSPSVQTLNFIINISDADMAADLDSANDQWFVLQQSQTPIFKGPFSPQFVQLYGKRMCYGVGNILYVSDISSPQTVTPDRHVVQSPKQLRLGYAFPLQGSTDLYVTGDRWLGRVTDNGDVPSTWAPPILISDTIGAPFPGCVCFRTAGGYAWIATKAGVFLFDGRLGVKPVTYLSQDQWARVNWAAAYAIETEDDIENRILYVAVPLDGATEVNGIFAIDYTNGVSFEQVDISLDLYQYDGAYSVAVGPDETGTGRLWIGSDRGNLLELYAAALQDVSGAITAIWESGFIRNPGDFASRMVRVGGIDVWARGNGGLTTTVYGPDKQVSVSPVLLSAAGVPSSLTPAPGIMYQHKFDLSKIENYTVRFASASLGIWFELSGLTVYSRPDLFNR